MGRNSVRESFTIEMEGPASPPPPRQPPNFRRKLSAREMDSLTAIGDTFLPSLSSDGNDESIKAFYFTSASMLGVPEQLGVHTYENLRHPLLWLLRITLWFLSTWYGTFFLCGLRSLTSRFPYFRKFSAVELRNREEILLSFSHSSFFLYRIFFRAIKFLVVLAYFTQVDDNGENPTWKALGYCGPDPNSHSSGGTTTTGSASSSSLESDFPVIEKPTPDYQGRPESAPLSGSLLHLHQPRNSINITLSLRGLSLLFPPRALPTIRCDAVVVGSGSGGGVVAGILAKAGYKVVVIEKGNYRAREDLPLLEGDAMENMYEGNGLLATTDLGVFILAGSTVGGGSHINWSASLRTPETVMREWSRDHEVELFGSDLYREAMDVVCERMGVHDKLVSHEGLNNAVLRRGCEELGYAVRNIPRNGKGDHDCGWCCFGCKDGTKKGTSETWLVDATESGNAVILPECKAVKVVTRRKRSRKVAGGVVFEYKDGRRFVVESKVTVVACGALNTPGLLRRSGLRNRHIGRNLRLHPVVMGWGTFDVQAEENRRSYEGSIMTAMTTAGKDENDDIGVVIQTPSLHPGMFSAVTPWLCGGDFKDRMTRFSTTAHVFALARDVGGGGWVGEKPTSVGYEMDARDEKRLQRGLERVLRILAAAGAREIGTHHCDGKKLKVKEVSYHSYDRFVREESSRTLRDLSTPVFSAHQMGSCRMGVDASTSAVAPNGETWEVDGLFVADASVFPSALGVNPMVTVQSIAYCTAQSVLHFLRMCHSTGIN